jgi:hypothetical protein
VFGRRGASVAICCLVAVTSVLLVPAAALADTITVTGTVTGPQGQPFAGIQITDPWDPSVPPALTDAQGHYAINVDQGGALIFVDPSGMYLPGCDSYESPGTTVVTDPNGNGECAGIGSVGIGSVELDVTLTALASHISGTVRGPNGLPLAGLTLTTLTSFSTSSTTDAAGHYRLDVPAGTETMMITPDSSTIGGCYNANAAGKVSPNGCTSVVVGNVASIVLPDIQLARALFVHGQIDLPVSLQADSGGLSVCLYSPAWTIWLGGKGRWCGPFETWTDLAGGYTFAALPGTYTLQMWWLQADQPDEVGCYSNGPGGSSFSLDLSKCTLITVGGDMTAPTVTIPSPGQTPVSNGSSVTVAPVEPDGGGTQATVTFSSVTGAGVTSLDVSQTGPAPGNFQLGSNPTYYDIDTTASFSGPATICLSYDPSSYSDSSKVRLYHYDGASQAWVDITTSKGTGPISGPYICGRTSSFSPFTIGEASGPVQSAQSITFEPLGAKTYGAPPISLSATASSGRTVSYSAAGQCSIDGSTLTIGGVGSCSVTASQAGDDSWLPASQVTQSFTINPAPLTIGAPTLTRAYGASNPTLAPSYSGLVAGDTAANLTSQPTCTTTATSSSSTGTYPVACSGAVDPNYTISYAAGMLTVAIADRFVTRANTTLTVSAPGIFALTTGNVSAVGVTSAPQGKLTLSASGAFTYVPKSGFVGTDTFTYKATLNGLPGPATAVTIYVLGSGANCKGCNLSGLSLGAVNLSGSNLSSTELTGTGLAGANLTGANLSNASLSNATMNGANLTGANLSNANLVADSLTQANLTGANFSKANLSNAKLNGAITTGANFSGVTWSATTCADGTNSDGHGHTCVGH